MSIGKRSGVVFTFCSLLMLTGCGDLKAEKERIEKVTGGPVKKVVPLSGIIRVNGQTEPGVVITLYGADGTKPIPLATPFTDEEGKFEVTTYQKGDGIEPGEYKLTFEWLKVIKKGGIDFIGPDKLKGAYRDPTKSPFLIKVEEGVPQKNIEIDLKAKS